MNSKNCINIETPLGLRCYKCSNPSAVPVFATNSNIGEIICNSKPNMSYGYKKDSSIPEVYTGSFQCNRNETGLMVSVQSKTELSVGDDTKGYFEPICQQILPL